MPGKRLKRIAGTRLQRIRREWFREHPFCQRCYERDGRIKAAAILDHTIALVNGGPDFDKDEGKNRQSLCRDCDKEKSAEDEGKRQRLAPTKFGADGFPIRKGT